VWTAVVSPRCDRLAVQAAEDMSRNPNLARHHQPPRATVLGRVTVHSPPGRAPAPRARICDAARGLIGLDREDEREVEDRAARRARFDNIRRVRYSYDGGMGTWDAGPFANDRALDHVGDVFDYLMAAVNAFMAAPTIDGDFDAAFASIAIMNVVMKLTLSRPYIDGEIVDGAQIRAAMLACFDEQIDGLEPAPGYKRDHRLALVSALDEFVIGLQR